MLWSSTLGVRGRCISSSSLEARGSQVGAQPRQLIKTLSQNVIIINNNNNNRASSLLERPSSILSTAKRKKDTYAVEHMKQTGRERERRSEPDRIG